MNFCVAYTLKHNETPDTFKDHWMPFRTEDGLTLDDAQHHYDALVESDGGEDGWHLWAITLNIIIKSSDY